MGVLDATSHEWWRERVDAYGNRYIEAIDDASYSERVNEGDPMNEWLHVDDMAYMDDDCSIIGSDNPADRLDRMNSIF